MKLQEILNQPEIQQELDLMMRTNWGGIPEDFKPKLDLNNPYGLQNLSQVKIEGLNNYSSEIITIKELNFLYLYCFVLDFNLFYFYERANTDEQKNFFFPIELKTFMRFSRLADIQELQSCVEAYKAELDNYITITGRDFLYLILD